MKKTAISVILIVVLLCIQAASDLALPDYTSKIVNIGIQAGGIEEKVPNVLSKEDYENLLLFTNDNNLIDTYKSIFYIHDNQNKFTPEVDNFYL